MKSQVTSKGILLGTYTSVQTFMAFHQTVIVIFQTEPNGLTDRLTLPSLPLAKQKRKKKKLLNEWMKKVTNQRQEDRKQRGECCLCMMHLLRVTGSKKKKKE